MLDPRLQNVVKRRDSYYVFLAHLNTKFHFSNSFSEGLVVQRLNNLLAKIDQINGAPVSDRVLIRGFQNRINDIPLRDRINNESQEQVSEENPHLTRLKQFDAAQMSPEEVERANILEEAKRWQEKKEAEAAQLAMEADPAWRARHTAAGEAYLLAFYSPVPESIYQAAYNRLKVCNDPVAFSEADKSFKERQQKRLAEADDKLKAERAKLDAELETLNLATEAKPPTAEAWELARRDAAQLKQSGMYPHAREEIAALRDGVMAGTIEPREFQQRVEAIRETANAAGSNS